MIADNTCCTKNVYFRPVSYDTFFRELKPPFFLENIEPIIFEKVVSFDVGNIFPSNVSLNVAVGRFEETIYSCQALLHRSLEAFSATKNCSLQ